MTLKTNLHFARLLFRLRKIWYNQPFTMARMDHTLRLLYRFITGKIFVLTAAAAIAAPLSFDLLSPDQVSSAQTGKLPDAKVSVLVVSLDPKVCPACARLKPVLVSLKMRGYNDIMEVGPHPKANVYPTIYIFRREKLVDTITGFTDEATLKARIDAAKTP